MESPTLDIVEKRTLEIVEKKLDIRDEAEQTRIRDEKIFERDTTWQSCCFKLDKRSVQFFSGLAISLIVMAVCIIKVLSHTDDSGVYLNLLILILGVYSPQPTLSST